jgi:hypothetical protein
MAHDFEFCDQHRYRLYDLVYGYRHSAWELQPRPMDDSDRHYFALPAGWLEAYRTLARSA